jgi:hypothetical protein
MTGLAFHVTSARAHLACALVLTWQNNAAAAQGKNERGEAVLLMSPSTALLFLTDCTRATNSKSNRMSA